jgi:hypothetical protein
MMNEPTRQQTSRRGIGAAFLAAMHDWRRRQAAREIEYYQHLIHNPRVQMGWLSAGRPTAEPAHSHPDAAPRPADQAKPRSRSGLMSLEMAAIVAALVIFAILHIVVGAMLMQRAARTPDETAVVLHHGD